MVFFEGKRASIGQTITWFVAFFILIFILIIFIFLVGSIKSSQENSFSDFKNEGDRDYFSKRAVLNEILYSGDIGERLIDDVYRMREMQKRDEWSPKNRRELEDKFHNKFEEMSNENNCFGLALGFDSWKEKTEFDLERGGNFIFTSKCPSHSFLPPIDVLSEDEMEYMINSEIFYVKFYYNGDWYGKNE